MRAVGTGTHPEGRYIKDQVFDVPAALDGSGGVHPDYADIIEKGWAKLVKPEDDPGRTKTQIANSIVRGDALNHPVDAALADKIGIDEALAITHTGDPEASPDQADPHTARESAVGTRGTQLQPSPRGNQPGGPADIGYAGGTGARDIERGGAAGDRGTSAEVAAAAAASTGGEGTSTGGSDGGEATDAGAGKGAAATLPGGDKAKQPGGGGSKSK